MYPTASASAPHHYYILSTWAPAVCHVGQTWPFRTGSSKNSGTFNLSGYVESFRLPSQLSASRGAGFGSRLAAGYPPCTTTLFPDFSFAFVPPTFVPICSSCFIWTICLSMSPLVFLFGLCILYLEEVQTKTIQTQFRKITKHKNKKYRTWNKRK